MAVAEQAGWTRSGRRLRDLRGRDRSYTIALFVLLLVPVAMALARAFRDGWIPSGDEANIATRALDVFSKHPPLTGLPSTSALYGDKISTNHPGPLEFYLLAIPLRVLGMTAGPLFTAAAINASCVLIACWVFFRRLGTTAMLWSGVLLLAVMWSAGGAVLVDTLSSNMTMYSVLATAVLVWALVDGDLRLLPLAAFVASYAAQQHLAAGLIVAPLVVVALIALIAHVVRADDPLRWRRARPWFLSAAGVAAVCWAPVIDNQLTGHPGNLSAIVKFARDNTRPTLGLKSGFYQAIHAIAPPTILGRSGANGITVAQAAGGFRIVLALVVVAAVIALAVALRRTSPAVARLALIALVLLIAGVVNGSNVPHSFESVRINLYRWTWAAALLTWGALGLGVGLLIARTSTAKRIAPRARGIVGPALIGLAALISGTVVVAPTSADHNREVPEFAIENHAFSELASRLDHHHPVLVEAHGGDATLSIGPALIFRLVRAGFTVETPGSMATTYGSNRAYRPRSNPATVIVASGRAEQPSGDGELIDVQPFGPKPGAEYRNLVATRAELIGELSNDALGRPVVLAAGAGVIIDREFSGLARYSVKYLFSKLPTDPSLSFGTPTFLRLLQQGLLVSPKVDMTKVQQLLDLPPYRYRGTYGDEQVEVHLIKPQ